MRTINLAFHGKSEFMALCFVQALLDGEQVTICCCTPDQAEAMLARIKRILGDVPLRLTSDGATHTIEQK
jgi:hypothetical protein